MEMGILRIKNIIQFFFMNLQYNGHFFSLCVTHLSARTYELFSEWSMAFLLWTLDVHVTYMRF